jgi:hypothetical protein
MICEDDAIHKKVFGDEVRMSLWTLDEVEGASETVTGNKTAPTQKPTPPLQLQPRKAQ